MDFPGGRPFFAQGKRVAGAAWIRLYTSFTWILLFLKFEIVKVVLFEQKNERERSFRNVEIRKNQ